MRIGVVTTSFPRVPGEAAGGFVAELCQWIAARGHELEVVAAGDPGHAEPWQEWPITRVLAAPGLFYEGGAPDALRGMQRHAQALAFQARMVNEIRKRASKWDGMVAHWLVPSAVACALATKDKPLWAIAHGGDVHLLERLKLTGLTARLLHRPEVKLSFVSSELRDRFLRNAGKAGKPWAARARVASMGIDLDRFAAARARAQKGETPLVVFVGRLVHLKGVDILLDALVGLERECKVVIAGAGPLDEALQGRARKLGLVLEWPGALDANERDQLLARADVVVVPSRSERGRSEGMPLVAVEALASGCQLIAARSGGLQEIPEGLCHHVAPEDPAALRGSLRRVLDGDGAADDAHEWLAGRSWNALAPTLVAGLNQAH